MDNKLSNHEMVELWDAAQHMLKNPLSQCFNATEVERFAEQHWRCGGRILNLLVKVQADWLRLATGSLALNGSQATALQQSVKIGGFWFAQFLQLQRAACAQWRNAANGLNPRSLAGVAVSEDAWRELAAAWQQGAQEDPADTTEPRLYAHPSERKISHLEPRRADGGNAGRTVQRGLNRGWRGSIGVRTTRRNGRSKRSLGRSFAPQSKNPLAPPRNPPSKKRVCFSFYPSFLSRQFRNS